MPTAQHFNQSKKCVRKADDFFCCKITFTVGKAPEGQKKHSKGSPALLNNFINIMLTHFHPTFVQKTDIT